MVCVCATITCCDANIALLVWKGGCVVVLLLCAIDAVLQNERALCLQEPKSDQSLVNPNSI